MVFITITSVRQRYANFFISILKNVKRSKEAWWHSGMVAWNIGRLGDWMIGGLGDWKLG
jgi:hypothetical protein